jgi:hypothetical protein
MLMVYGWIRFASFLACLLACADPWGWLEWHDDLSKPLGQPMGSATMHKGSHGRVLYQRSYGGGVNVSLFTDVGMGGQGNLPTDCTGCIQWADGTVTGTCPPTPAGWSISSNPLSVE